MQVLGHPQGLEADRAKMESQQGAGGPRALLGRVLTQGWKPVSPLGTGAP